MSDPLTEALDIIERHAKRLNDDYMMARTVCPHCRGTGVYSQIGRCTWCAGTGVVVVERERS